MIFIIKKYW